MIKRLIAAVLCCLMFTGCASPSAAPTTEPEAPPISAAPTDVQTEPATEPKLLTFTLYHGNDNADGFVTSQVEVPEINEDVVLQKLIEAGVMPETVSINNIDSEGSQLNIDFNAAFYDYLCTMGTSGEMILIGSVVNTFLSAYQAESIFLTVDGEIIESGHVIYDFPMGYTA